MSKGLSIKDVHRLWGKGSAKSRQMRTGAGGGWLPKSGRSLGKKITLHFSKFTQTICRHFFLLTVYSACMSIENVENAIL